MPEILKLALFLGTMLFLLVPFSAEAVNSTYGNYGNLTYKINSNNTITIVTCDADATEVVIPSEMFGKNVTTIGAAAFSSRKNLINITIPDSIVQIGEGAFYGCTNLTSVYITDIAAWCNINFIGNNSSPMGFADEMYLNGSSLVNLIIPQEATKIPYGAFWGCDSIETVTIFDNAASIGAYAFFDCDSLTSVTIGNGVTSIGSYAFSYCDSLTSVTIPGSVTSVGERAFYYCTKLSHISLPRSVTEIEADAFYGCDSVSTVDYEGSETEWAEIYIGENNGSLLSATINYGYIPPVRISYSANGGSGAPNYQLVVKNTDVILSDVIPIKENCTFLGWATESDATKART